MKKLIAITFILVSLQSIAQQKTDSLAPELKDTCSFHFPKELAETFNAVLTGQDFSHKKYLLLLEMWQAQIPSLYKKK